MVRGTIMPAGDVTPVKVAAHPFRRMSQDEASSVDETMHTLRSGRTMLF